MAKKRRFTGLMSAYHFVIALCKPKWGEQQTKLNYLLNYYKYAHLLNTNSVICKYRCCDLDLDVKMSTYHIYKVIFFSRQLDFYIINQILYKYYTYYNSTAANVNIER